LTDRAKRTALPPLVACLAHPNPIAGQSSRPHFPTVPQSRQRSPAMPMRAPDTKHRDSPGFPTARLVFTAVTGCLVFVVAMVAAGNGLSESARASPPPIKSLVAGGAVWVICGASVYKTLRRAAVAKKVALVDAALLGPGGLLLITIASRALVIVL
jgi:hypothetical protein